MHPGQHPFSREFFGPEPHQQRGIGVLPAPGGIAHPVRDHAALFRGGGKDLPARAHAEAEDPGPVREMDVQAVIRRREIPAGPAVLRAVDGRLPVLDAHPHGKGLPLHRDALLMQSLKGVPGRVSDGEDDLPAGERGFRPAGHYRDPGEPPYRSPAATGSAGTARGGRPSGFRRFRFRQQPCEPGAEADFPAEGENFLPDVLHHGDQHIGADVGLRVTEHRFVRPVPGKLLQHPGDARIVGAGVELPVGEGPGAALAELHVVLRVQRAAGPEGFHGAAAGVHVLPPLQHDGAQARLCQHQGGEHPRRAEAHHNGPGRICRTGPGEFHFRNLIHRGAVFRHIRVPGAAAQNSAFVPLHADGHRADPAELRFPARVQRAPLQHARRDLLRRQPELFCRQCGQLFSRLRKFFISGGQPQIPYQNHDPSLPARAPLAQAHCRL